MTRTCGAIRSRAKRRTVDWKTESSSPSAVSDDRSAAAVDRATATFIQRDHHAGNVLWSYGRVSGVVDWVEACVGPPAVDFARARLNLAAQMGVPAARRYAKCPGIEVDPVWDIVDACDCGRGTNGSLPGANPHPGLEAFVADALSELG